MLVTGPTGSGKSTTLCALIDLVNRERTDHIITIEDPIEFVHDNKRSIITQREVGIEADGDVALGQQAVALRGVERHQLGDPVEREPSSPSFAEEAGQQVLGAAEPGLRDPDVAAALGGALRGQLREGKERIDAAAKELGQFGITVNAVCPGSTAAVAGPGAMLVGWGKSVSYSTLSEPICSMAPRAESRSNQKHP